jgi:hypothetical protein
MQIYHIFTIYKTIYINILHLSTPSNLKNICRTKNLEMYANPVINYLKACANE